MRVGRLRGLDCDQPMFLLHSCGATSVARCNNHRASKCVPCSWRYRRRLVRIADDGAPAGGHLYMGTWTAPGAHEHRMPSGDLCPCTPEGGVNLAEWNPSASGRWNVMRGQIKRAVPDLQYLRVVEVQKRGALHLHVLLWSPVPLDKAFLRRLAIANGFGHEFDLAPIVPGSRRHAYYVAKYVSKACDSRSEVPWNHEDVDQATGEIVQRTGPGRYRTWSSSHGWGLTMKAINEVCAAQRERRMALLAGLSEESTADKAPSVPSIPAVGPDPPT